MALETNGVNPKKRAYESKLFHNVKDIITLFLVTTKCTNAKEIMMFLRNNNKLIISTKMIYKFIKKIGFSRKRVKTRGTCKGDLEHLKHTFKKSYQDALNTNKVIVAIDECSFSERVVHKYGYSEIGSPCVIKVKGSWVQHSVLMAVNSCGEVVYFVKQGSIIRHDFEEFIDSLNLGSNDMILMDNASIHKNIKLHTNPVISYTPPEFNCIELCFGIIKNKFRKLNIDGVNGGIHDIINSSIDVLSPNVIINCFNHTFNNYIKV
jgi:hypothetical protein